MYYKKIDKHTHVLAHITIPCNHIFQNRLLQFILYPKNYHPPTPYLTSREPRAGEKGLKGLEDEPTQRPESALQFKSNGSRIKLRATYITET